MKNRKSENSRPKAARLVSVNSMPNSAVSQTTTSGYKLHLAMDKESYARLLWLKASLEASTESEVIRRALQAYEIFEPADAHQKGGEESNLATETSNDSIEHLYIRISQRIKERLDAERETSGLSYGEQVRHALRVLMQLTREREKVLRGVRSTDNNTDDSMIDLDNIHCCDQSGLYGGKVGIRRIMSLC